MRIGIDIRTLTDRQYSGVSLYTLNLIRELLRLDRQNKYILYYNSFQDLSSITPDFKQDNVEIVSTRYPNKIFNYILQKIFKWPKLDKVLGGVDVFWSPHLNFVNLSKDCKYVLTIHDLSFLKYPEFFSIRKNIWHKLVDIKTIADRADAVITISANTKRDIIAILNQAEQKLKVIYPGLPDGSELRPGDNQGSDLVKNKYKLSDKFILFLSTIEPRKNLLGLLEAFESAAGQVGLKDYYLVIVGNPGWSRQQTMDFYSKMKYKNRVKLIGYSDESEKRHFYNLASMLVYPSFYEGFGFPPLEAMSVGTPVISSANSSLLESVRDAALLIDPDNTASIATAIVELASDDDLRQSLITKGFEQAKLFTWSKTAEQYLEIFKKLKND